MAAFGTEGTPVFQLMSSTNIPTNKLLQIQSNVALVFKVVSLQGTFINLLASPDGAGPYTASGTINIPYPTVVNVDVFDKSTFQWLGMGTITLNGGDVFKCRLTYIENIPIANGYMSVLLNGERMIVRGEDYQSLPYENDDVIPRGSGEG
jgi:hypothetical protein